MPDAYRSVMKPLSVLILLVFFFSNLTKGIIPETKYVNNPYLAMTYHLDEVLTSGNDVILFPPKDRYFTGIYRYFGKGDAIHVQTGKHFINRDEMMNNMAKYESETLEMLNNRYDRIFMTRSIYEMDLTPLVFTPNNYRMPHPRFMIVGRDRIKLVQWHEVYMQYYAEVIFE